jgi:hypothetical protein
MPFLPQILFTFDSASTVQLLFQVCGIKTGQRPQAAEGFFRELASKLNVASQQSSDL